MSEKKGYNRRDFLKILGASSGVAAAGCGQELPEKLIPYVVQPDEIIPGVAAWYAGTCGECAAGCGVLVRTREGRVTKVEGNAAHPINRGGLCARGQSSVQTLYSPDRVREPLKRGVNDAFRPSDWPTAVDELVKTLSTISKTGKEIALVTRPLGPSETALTEKFQGKLKGVQRYEYDLLGTQALESAAEAVFGQPLRTQFDFSKADVVFGVGADYLETWHSPVAHTKGFSSRRRPRKSNGAQLTISKVYHVEPRLSVTASNADHWFKNAPGYEHKILQALLVELVNGAYGLKNAQRSKYRSSVAGKSAKQLLEGSGISLEELQGVAQSLVDAEHSLVLAGGSACSGAQNELCAELSFYLNDLLGAIGSTVLLTASPARPLHGLAGMKRLTEKLTAGDVAAVIFVDVNPVFTLPSALSFSKALGEASLVLTLGTQLDETAMVSHVVLPGLTSFESWNDSEPIAGVHNLNQPAMHPLYEGQSYGDLLLALGAKDAIGMKEEGLESFHDYLQQQWRSLLGEGDFENKWLQAVERGGLWKQVPPKTVNAQVVGDPLRTALEGDAQGLQLIAFPTVHLGDGSAANRPWAQEVPDPMTTAVWGSWIEVHTDVAEKMGFSQGDIVRLRTPQGSVESPLYVTPHIHPSALAMPIGQGHSGFGRFATGVGANPLRIVELADTSGSFRAGSVALEKTVSRDALVLTQGHDSQLDRGLARTVTTGTLAASLHGDGHGDHGDGHGGHGDGASTAAAYGVNEFHHHDPKALGPQPEPKQMYEQMEHVEYRWGMSVDLASCTGCSACVTACYAENNVPVVGKDLCVQGREMSWIRIERYLDGPASSPVTAFSPVMCQHCNNAPCEPVCPVYATYHNEEGLNMMVYNRCVGTRYCSNNCSYKVRRFNWFNYEWQEPLTWQLNPDVTVRSVGVMEKCSFCIQRIKEVQNVAKDQGRQVRDGEVQPACASSCPADAISFGNLKDTKSKVYKNSQSERSYRMLNVELNTQPSVYYLAKVVHGEEEKEASHS